MSGDCTCKSQPTYAPDDTLTYVWTAKDEKDDNVTNDVFVDEKGESLGDKTSGENLSRIRFKAKKAETYYMTVTVDDGKGEEIDAPIDIDVVKPIFNTSENLILI